MASRNTSSPIATPSSVHFKDSDSDKYTVDHLTAEEPCHLHHHNHHNHLCYHQHHQMYSDMDLGTQHLLIRSDPLEVPERDPEDLKSQRPIPTIVVPVYRQRLVLVKIADNFLRLGTGARPIVSKLKPPLLPHMEDDLMAYLDSRIPGGCKILGRRNKRSGFNYQDFTFTADESCSITESWYRNARAFCHIRLGVKRNAEAEKETEYLCAVKTPNGQYEVQFDKHTFGSWWRITAVSENQYVAESVQYPARCLVRDSLNNLSLTSPLTERDRANIAKGKWDNPRTLTIITLPDFAVWHPGVVVD